MNYRPRMQEQLIGQMADYFKIVFLVGARQVGKSTLLSHLWPESPVIVFDPIWDVHSAKADPELFLNKYRKPLILDEVQFVPELLPVLKRRVDLVGKPGQYFMTGSQQMSILKSVTESLAGRVAIVEIGPMSPAEAYRLDFQKSNWLQAYLADPHSLLDRFQGVTGEELPPLFDLIWRGGMPGVLDLPENLIVSYFASYIQTYVERDVRTLEDITNLAEFTKFFSLLAALTSQEINYSQLGREIGLSPATAKRWLNLLQYTYQWKEVPAFHGNLIKRVSSKPKGYFTDTGLACALMRFSTSAVIFPSNMAGPLFETFCFNLIRTFSSVLPISMNIYHWRSQAGSEVDLILELDGKFYPIEIKIKGVPSGHDARGILAFRQSYPHLQIMPGLVLHAGSHCYWLGEHAIALPWNSLLV